VTIYEHIAACAHESNLRENAPHGAAHRALAAALQDDPEMLAQAREMASVPEHILQRDHISRWQVATLRGVLPKE
jgi:hypothetical protein